MSRRVALVAAVVLTVSIAGGHPVPRTPQRPEPAVLLTSRTYERPDSQAIAAIQARKAAKRAAHARWLRYVWHIRWLAAVRKAKAAAAIRPAPSYSYAPVTYTGSHQALWLCIHSHEGGWAEDSGNGYFGGLQLSLAFQQTYGSSLLASLGTANHWSADQQIGVAESAWRINGYNVRWLLSQWPVSGAMCL